MIPGSSTKTPEEQVAETKQELDKYGLKPVEQVEVRDPFTGKTSLVTIDRTGHNEKKLIVALADPNLSRDQKDHALSMYLFERGAQNVSMLVDLMRYKGEHTKETRVFESRVRFDFESFVNSFVQYLQKQSELLAKAIGIDVAAERAEFVEWLKLPHNQKMGYTYVDFYRSRYLDTKTDDIKSALIEMAIYAQDEAEHLMLQVNQIKQAREAQKGGGIYVDRMGRPYSVNDPNIEEIIKQDRDLQKDAEQGF